jgi:hypothetical protein
MGAGASSKAEAGADGPPPPAFPVDAATNVKGGIELVWQIVHDYDGDGGIELAIFQKWLGEQHAEEGICFIVQCRSTLKECGMKVKVLSSRDSEAMRNSCVDGIVAGAKEDIVQALQGLYDEYLRPGASQEVCISNKSRRNLEKALKAQETIDEEKAVQVMKPVLKEVMVHLAKDKMPAYVKYRHQIAD